LSITLGFIRGARVIVVFYLLQLVPGLGVPLATGVRSLISYIASNAFSAVTNSIRRWDGVV